MTSLIGLCKTWILHHILTKFRLFLLIYSKHVFFISWIWKLISCLVVREMKKKEGRKSKGREREEVRVVHRRIALIQFLQKKGLLWKNNGTVLRIVLRKFLEHKRFSKLWVVRKVWNSIKKEKVWNIGESVKLCILTF